MTTEKGSSDLSSGISYVCLAFKNLSNAVKVYQSNFTKTKNICRLPHDANVSRLFLQQTATINLLTKVFTHLEAFQWIVHIFYSWKLLYPSSQLKMPLKFSEKFYTVSNSSYYFSFFYLENSENENIVHFSLHSFGRLNEAWGSTISSLRSRESSFYKTKDFAAWLLLALTAATLNILGWGSLNPTYWCYSTWDMLKTRLQVREGFVCSWTPYPFLHSGEAEFNSRSPFDSVFTVPTGNFKPKAVF